MPEVHAVLVTGAMGDIGTHASLLESSATYRSPELGCGWIAVAA